PISLRHLLAYSLGIRLLRQDRWDEAAAWLRTVPRATYVSFNRGRRNWDGNPPPDPLYAAWQLGGLQRAVSRARTDNDRAAALYRYASFYYHHGTLLLYNPVLWQHEREYGFQFWWNKRHATDKDDKALWTHMYEHEVYARALALCLKIADRYPRSP